MSGTMNKSTAPPPPPTGPSANLHLVSAIGRDKLHTNGDNYPDWIRNMRMMCRFDLKEYVLDTPLGSEPDKTTTAPEVFEEWHKHFEDANKVSCVMVTCMERDLAERFENTWAYEINQALGEMFGKKARHERLQTVKGFFRCSMKEGDSVCNHVQNMDRHIERLKKLDVVFDDELVIDILLASLTPSFDQFILNFMLREEKTTMQQIHGLLKQAEENMKPPLGPKVAAAGQMSVNAIGHGRGKKRKASAQPNWKGKAHTSNSGGGSKGRTGSLPPVRDPKEAQCFYCFGKGPLEK